MSAKDKCVLESFISLISNKISKSGYCIEEINLTEINDNNIYNYYLKIISSRIIPYNVHIPSFLIAPFAEMFESIGLSVYIGRDSKNTPIFKINEFKYVPSPQYLHSFTAMGYKIKQTIKELLIDISYALNAEDLSAEKVIKIRGELCHRTCLLSV